MAITKLSASGTSGASCQVRKTAVTTPSTEKSSLGPRKSSRASPLVAVSESATGRGGYSQAGLSGLIVSNLRIPGYAMPWERDLAPFPGRLATPLSIMIDAPLGGAAPAAARYTPGPQPEAVRLGPLGTGGGANDGRPSRLKPWAGMERCPTPPGMAQSSFHALPRRTFCLRGSFRAA